MVLLILLLLFILILLLLCICLVKLGLTKVVMCSAELSILYFGHVSIRKIY